MMRSILKDPDDVIVDTQKNPAERVMGVRLVIEMLKYLKVA